MLGLGVGSLSCVLRPADHLTYYEIDPEVIRIASDPAYFTFLTACPPHINTVLGDARLKIKEAPDASYDIVVLDVFSSDAIPVHLLTQEAVALYLSKLKPDGILVFHISNRYMQLERVVAGIATDLGLSGLYQFETEFPADLVQQQKSASKVVVLARNPAQLETVRTHLETVRISHECEPPSASDIKSQQTVFYCRSWQPLEKVAARPVLWTDDFSSVWDVLDW